MKLTYSILLASLVLTLGPALCAQDQGDQVDIQELVRQIRRNMVDIEKEIDKVEAEAAKEAAKDAKENIQKLVDSLKGRGNQITSDIDAIIANLRC